MGSIENISELCRLCLVKDQVNVPIFEENATKEQTFVKINSCLPVKVSRDDSLPKKICDGCSCKLDMLYTFRNTSVDSEKQLLKWLNQAGLSCSQSAVKDPLASTKPEVTIKQETFEPTDSRDDLGLDTHSYIMQQQKLPYSQEFEFGEPSESNVGLMTDEPAPKKAKRAAALNKASVETDEDDLDAAMQITKAEDEDSDEIDQPEYVEAPSTSADDQPGPSGVNKTTVEAPYIPDILTPIVTIKELESKPRRRKRKPALVDPCDICGKTFKQKTGLKDHLQMHSKYFTCEKCGTTYKKLIDYVIHMRIHNDQMNFECIFCDYTTDNIVQISDHLKNRHDQIKPYTCDICKQNFPILKWFKDHENDHKNLKPYNCDLCGKNFAYARYLSVHRALIHKANPDLHECVICKKQYQHKNSLKLHMNSHTGNVSVCDVCGKILSSKEKLKFHLRTHTGYKPFCCTYCGKCFTKKPILVEHIRIHTGEKPYVCEYCMKAFSQRSSLVIHIRGHTGERPYVCSACGKGFVAKAMLNIHLKSCKGPYLFLQNM
ncbi:zinc finger protein 62 homolog isoform X14 [Tribolium castaneum]|uniref:zinc finger protein 62 homolog isoform X14 n=1 Tax=Tribolium castaneum TaxID=7070 RepID=UPI00077DCAB5|nr:PREDICTED: zinc finger protein 62 homolog isoform X15 [Tribolium castaneum]|eukprot:XP_015834130.1 PREDICTED: zinc finger protein 62 homolog isoform X15 [Tribolium castaneum]